MTLPLLLDATTDLFGESLSKRKAFLMKALILTPCCIYTHALYVI